MLYDFRFKYFKGKLMTRWLGPYLVEKCHENGAIQIRTIDDEGISFLVNGYRMTLYRKPISKAKFVSTIKKEVNVVGSVIASNTHHL